MRASQALEASSTLVARSRDESIFFYIHAKKHENIIEAPFIKVSYDDAWHLLTRYTQSDSLRYHARQVQSAMATSLPSIMKILKHEVWQECSMILIMKCIQISIAL